MSETTQVGRYVLHRQIARDMGVVLADVAALGTARMQQCPGLHVELVYLDVRRQRITRLVQGVLRVDLIGPEMPLQERLEETLFQPRRRLRPGQRQRRVQT